MTAEIIAVGSELLGASRLDTNSLYLSRELAGLGIRVVRKTVLPDEVTALAAAIREASLRAPLLILTGGLGPTDDDRTRAAAALAFQLPLHRDADAVAALRQYFAVRRRSMPEINLRQADRLEGAQLLPNPVGSAPGQWLPYAPDRAFVLLPGPSDELQAMFQAELRSRLAPFAPHSCFFSRVLSLAGMTESEVDTIAAPIYRGYSNPATTILAAAPGQVEIHLDAHAPTPLQAEIQADCIAELLRARLGTAVFSDARESLAAVVGRLLMDRDETVALAESCTGGLLGHLLTGVPGASRFFLGGAICYSDALKRQWARVPSGLLKRHGAVSAPVACALADGIRLACGSAWGIAITGIAGPDGGTDSKPVGTVFIALSHSRHSTAVANFHFGGERNRIRQLSAQTALNQLRLLLLGQPMSAPPIQELASSRATLSSQPLDPPPAGE